MERFRGPDAGVLLVRALRLSAADAGVAVAVEPIGERPWASATFVGTRHRVAVTQTHGAGLKAWLDSLPGAELKLRGHLIAELAIETIAYSDGIGRATLAVLTLIEG